MQVDFFLFSSCFFLDELVFVRQLAAGTAITYLQNTEPGRRPRPRRDGASQPDNARMEDGGWSMEHGAWSMSMTRSPRRFPLARTLFGGDLPGTGLRSSLLATDKTKRAAPSHLTSSAVRGYCDGPEFCDFRDFAVAQLDVRRPRPWH